jgi:DNA-binding GntR family transcriptional regulator
MVYQRLRTAILKGEIAAGAAPSQVELANQLGVSRTPLREAFRLLEREGLVLSEPNHRARVAEFSISDVEELYLSRVSVEAIAARLTIPRLTADDFAHIEGFMAQMDYFARLGEWQRAESPHLAFHTRLVAGVGLRVTAQLVQWAEHAARYRLNWGQIEPCSWETRRAEHRLIIEAAAAGDADLTAARLVAHYARTALVVMAALDPEHQARSLLTAMEVVAPPSIDIIRTRLKGVAGRALQRMTSI